MTVTRMPSRSRSRAVWKAARSVAALPVLCPAMPGSVTLVSPLAAAARQARPIACTWSSYGNGRMRV
ncbi:hypothetical protein ACIA74_39005 [Streptomyces sp. NPDC051658]|uniref:hypothetical protein n=1 Tax=Streptomyces sp. NPDC051658 TaxID=3365667 RepID=UPI00379BF3A6